MPRTLLRLKEPYLEGRFGVPVQAGRLVEAQRFLALGAGHQRHAIASLPASDLDRALDDLSAVAALAVIAVRHDVLDHRERASAPRKVG